MTHLQILRSILQAGYTVTMHKLDDGYHIELTSNDESEVTARWEIMDARLDQAIIRLTMFVSKDFESSQG